MKKHYFLYSCEVIYQKNGMERAKKLNSLLVSDERTVTRQMLANVQHQAQVRFKTEFDVEGQCEITDVFTISISHLGHMTEQEFHGQFYVAPEQPQEAPVEVPVDADVEMATDKGEASVEEPKAE